MNVGQFIRFCEDVLVHPQGDDAGRPLRFEDWQVELFEEAMRLTEFGRAIWAMVVICIPRGNGKTLMLAAYALYRLLADDDNPRILLCASSDQQAGRLFEYAKGMVERSPYLLARIAIQEHRGRLYRLDGQGEIRRLSSNPKTAHGWRPSLVICDELAQWTQPQLRQTWAALTSAGAGRRLAQVFVISTAGRAHERAEGILGRILDANEQGGDVTRPHDALTIARNLESGVLTINYSAATSSIEDVDAIKRANPRRGVTRELLAR
jgi:phage terminase large subunit-like protein